MATPRLAQLAGMTTLLCLGAASVVNDKSDMSSRNRVVTFRSVAAASDNDAMSFTCDAFLQMKRNAACSNNPQLEGHVLKSLIADHKGALVIAIPGMRCTEAVKAALHAKGVTFKVMYFDGPFKYSEGASEVWDWLHCTYPGDKSGPMIMHSYVFLGGKFLGNGFAAADKVASGELDAQLSNDLRMLHPKANFEVDQFFLSTKVPIFANKIFNEASLAPDLLCWTLVRDGTYETELVRYQLQHDLLGNCGGNLIFSDVALADDMQSTFSVPSLNNEVGGIWKTALNVPVFKLLWWNIIARKTFLNYRWILKIDVDTAFSLTAVQDILKKHDDGSAKYINNHASWEPDGSPVQIRGPIEILSRGALETWSANFEKCTGDPKMYSEDVFVSECMNVLGIPGEYEEKLLLDRTSWEHCSDGHAAYHPFKSVEEWRNCHDRIALASQ